ncbi:MAG TPA: SCO family protein [Methylomirabilota bacterium]|nr:SCO family protein [Methylomirabilota bacterium]
MRQVQSSTLVTAIVVALAVLAPAGHAGDPLPQIGPAADFTLTTQEGNRLSLHELRGKVVAVTFIYTSCADTCPLLTAKLVGLGSRLGALLGSRVAFVAISVDPERDTPPVLKRYAQEHGARTGWTFLTGTRAEISVAARRYGIYYRKTPRGDIDHTFLTSVIDRDGVLRVQYLGVRFDPDELLRDLQSLVRENPKG